MGQRVPSARIECLTNYRIEQSGSLVLLVPESNENFKGSVLVTGRQILIKTLAYLSDKLLMVFFFAMAFARLQDDQDKAHAQQQLGPQQQPVVVSCDMAPIRKRRPSAPSLP